jgi:hypothetical protein
MVTQGDEAGPNEWITRMVSTSQFLQEGDRRARSPRCGRLRRAVVAAPDWRTGTGIPWRNGIGALDGARGPGAVARPATNATPPSASTAARPPATSIGPLTATVLRLPVVHRAAPQSGSSSCSAARFADVSVTAEGPIGSLSTRHHILVSSSTGMPTSRDRAFPGTHRALRPLRPACRPTGWFRRRTAAGRPSRRRRG